VRRWRWPAAIVLVAILGFLAYGFLFGGEKVTPHLLAPEATARIGSGEDAVAVAADGSLLPGLALPDDGEGLPALPLSEPPKGGHLAGPVLQQARVLGATPTTLRPYVERSYYGESGVDVILDVGIELRFGDASQAARKWAAAATVLADPTISRLDYVDLHAPRHPAYGGEGHELPPLPEG
jgi:hypothetical protein